MFDWVLNMPLCTAIFSLKKMSEWKDKQSSDIQLNELKKSSDRKKVELGRITYFFETNLISWVETNFIV